MRVPFKLILSALLLTCGIGGLTTPAGATDSPTLISVVSQTSCAPDGNVSAVARITNVWQQPVNVQAVEESTAIEHHIIDFPVGDQASFEFPLLVPQVGDGELIVYAAIPGREDDEAAVQIVYSPYLALDCRNSHEPADTQPVETSTTLVPTTTSSIVPTATNPVATSTTTSTTLPEPMISATSIVREAVPATTSVATEPVAELAYTGSDWISLQAKIAWTVVIVGLLCVYISWSMRKNALARRQQQRRDKLAKLRTKD